MSLRSPSSQIDRPCGRAKRKRTAAPSRNRQPTKANGGSDTIASLTTTKVAPKRNAATTNPTYACIRSPIGGKLSVQCQVPSIVMTSDEHTDDTVLPLRDRIPEYLTVFAAGLGASAGVGLLIGLIFGQSLWSGVGYTVIMYGVVMLLAGGASGGGYTNLGAGAIGAAFSGRRFDEEGQEDQERQAGQRQDPLERLRKGLRPEANPRAFWQVIAGVVYIAMGISIVSLGG